MVRINKIKINNILGIEHLEYDPNTINVVVGENGSGKTSFLNALRAALQTGTDATLLRKGAEKGEAVIVLDNETEIRRRVSEKGTPSDLKHPTFGRSTTPAGVIKGLTSALQLDPIAFVTAKKEQRVDMLLRLIPWKIDSEILSYFPKEALNKVNPDDHGLAVIDRLDRNVYDLRTGVNRLVEDKRKAVEVLQETLPEAPPSGNWGETLSAAQAELSALNRSAQEDARKKESEHARKKEEVKRRHDNFKQSITINLNAVIERLKMKASQDIEISEQRLAKDIEAEEGHHKEVVEKASAEFQEEKAPILEKIGNAKAMIEQNTKAEVTRDNIAAFTAEADRLAMEAQKLTDARERLADIKAKFLANLPFKGLSIRDGDIYIGEIPFETINTAEKVKFLSRLIKLLSPELPIFIMDNIECLDSKTRVEWLKELENFEGQVFYACVTDGPFEIIKGGLHVEPAEN